MRRGHIVGQLFGQRNADRHFNVMGELAQDFAHKLALARRKMRTLHAIERSNREIDFLARRALRIGGQLRQPAHVVHVPRGKPQSLPHR